MATVQQHIQQWKHNRGFISTIGPNFPDWIVTVSFYVAIHSIEALLAYDGVRGVRNHEDRKLILEQTNRYSLINEKFKTLYTLSRTVRYFADTSGWVPFVQIEQNVIKRYVYPIEASVQKLIKQDLNLPLITLASAPPSTPAPATPA
jgi:hypothetical protein